MRPIYLLIATLACAAALPAATPADPVLAFARDALPEPLRKGHIGGPGKRDAEAEPEPIKKGHFGGPDQGPAQH